MAQIVFLDEEIIPFPLPVYKAAFGKNPVCPLVLFAKNSKKVIIITHGNSNGSFMEEDIVLENIQYFDGLGRPIQTIQVVGSPTGRSIRSPLSRQ